MNQHEQLILRIMNTDEHFSGLNLDDIVIHILKRKENRTDREELIFRAIRTNEMLSNIILKDLFLVHVRNLREKSIKDELLIRTLKVNSDLVGLELKDMLEHTLYKIERVNRTYQEQLILKVLNNKLNKRTQAFS